MVNFNSTKSNIHVLSRGILKNRSGIVLCKVKGADWFFLPGGHVENGEIARDSLLRELKEELGENIYKIGSFLGSVENIFSLEDKTTQHEINLIFEVEIPDSFNPKSTENDLEFTQVKVEEIGNYNILPKQLKESLINWTISGSLFLNI